MKLEAKTVVMKTASKNKYAILRKLMQKYERSAEKRSKTVRYFCFVAKFLLKRNFRFKATLFALKEESVTFCKIRHLISPLSMHFNMLGFAYCHILSLTILNFEEISSYFRSHIFGPRYL